MDPQSEVSNFFRIVSSWREESQKELSNIIFYYSSSMNESINDLVGQHSVIIKERNDLLEKVDNLNCEVWKLNQKLHSIQSLPEPGGNCNQNYEEGNSKRNELPGSDEQGKDIDNENIDQEQSTDLVGEIAGETNSFHKQNDLTDSSLNDVSINTIEHVVEDGERANVEKQKNLIRNTNNTHFESHICPECNFILSTAENLNIHLMNLHSKSDLNKVSIAENEISRQESEFTQHTKKNDAALYS